MPPECTLHIKLYELCFVHEYFRNLNLNTNCKIRMQKTKQPADRPITTHRASSKVKCNHVFVPHILIFLSPLQCEIFLIDIHILSLRSCFCLHLTTTAIYQQSIVSFLFYFSPYVNQCDRFRNVPLNRFSFFEAFYWTDWNDEKYTLLATYPIHGIFLMMKTNGIHSISCRNT